MRYVRELDRRTGVDIGLAMAAGAIGMPLALLRPDEWPDVGAFTPLVLVVAAAGLLVRRRYPVPLALALSAAVTLAPVVVAPLFVALYGVGAYARRQAALVTWLVVAVETVVLQIPDGAEGLVRGPVIALALGFPVAVGMAVDAQRRLLAELVDRAERAEREQELLADNAVAAERARLARELHDVVAHRVSLMVLHAGALELAPPAATATSDAAEAALIGAIGRQALDELRQMLNVLRDGDEGTPLAPLPGIAEVHDLAESSRAAGLTVTVTEDGDVTALPGSVGRTAFRVVQEALTNAHKHATGAAVDVRLRRHAAGLDVEVVNHRPGREPLDVPGGGHGLAGLRERVALLGGRVAVGPTAEGGWAVRAELPAP